MTHFQYCFYIHITDYRRHPSTLRLIFNFLFSPLLSRVDIPLPAWRAWETAAFVISFLFLIPKAYRYFPFPNRFSYQQPRVSAWRVLGIRIQDLTEKPMPNGSLQY